MELFPFNVILGFVAINTLGPLTKMKEGSQFIIVMTHRYSRPRTTVLVPKVAASHIAVVGLGCWIVPYDIPNMIMTDNVPQIALIFIDALGGAVGTKLITTTE